MTDEQECSELTDLFDGVKTDAEDYFKKAAQVFENLSFEWSGNRRDVYWRELSEDIRGEARRLDRRLVSLMGQIARAVRNAPLASEADQRDVMTGTKAMRAALLLRKYRSWDVEIEADEDIVLGVRPAGQSDDDPAEPDDAGRTFAEWAQKINAILDLLAALLPTAIRETGPRWKLPGIAPVRPSS
jgi:hypothetical protein